MKLYLFSSIISVIALCTSCTLFKSNEINELKHQNTALGLELGALKSEQEALEANKQLVINFFNEVFNELNVEAFHKYIGDVYIQHDPDIEDGKEALIAVMEDRFKHMTPNSVEIKRIFAEKDLVFIHTKSSDLSLMHVFRIENKMIAEHWMTVQPVPETSKNSNTMF